MAGACRARNCDLVIHDCSEPCSAKDTKWRNKFRKSSMISQKLLNSDTNLSIYNKPKQFAKSFHMCDHRWFSASCETLTLPHEYCGLALQLPLLLEILTPGLEHDADNTRTVQPVFCTTEWFTMYSLYC